MVGINTNINALYAQASLATNQIGQTTAIQQLSTGLRINSSKDDAAAVAISSKLTTSVRSMSLAIRNANDGVSICQTADASLGSVANMLQRMRELTLQSANGAIKEEDRKHIKIEVDQLKQQIDVISKTTNFNGIHLFDGGFSKIDIQSNINAHETISIKFPEISSKSLGVGPRPGLTAAGNTGRNVSPNTLARGLSSGDLIINDITIGSSEANADSVSYSDKESSAIAKAAAVNKRSNLTGVIAKVGETVASGVAIKTGLAGASTIITINGVNTDIITLKENTGLDKDQIINAINQINGATGVTAVSGGNDYSGIKLIALDGRNITVNALSLNGPISSANLGLDCPMNMAKGGPVTVTTGTVVLQSIANEDIKVRVQPNTDIVETGLGQGIFKANETYYTTQKRPMVDNAASIKFLHSGDLAINGITVPESLSIDDDASFDNRPYDSNFVSSKAASAIAIAAAINKVSDQTGVVAKPNLNEVIGNEFTKSNGKGSYLINGIQIDIDLSKNDTLDFICKTINLHARETGVYAKENGSAITLYAPDGRNIVLSALGSTNLKPSDIGLGRIDLGNTFPSVTRGIIQSSYNALNSGNYVKPVPVDPMLTLSGSGNLDGAIIKISNNFDAGHDKLVFANTANISGIYDPVKGILTLSGIDTVQNYETALRTVSFQTDSSAQVGVRDIDFTIGTAIRSNNGNFYKLNSTKLSWDDARTAAENSTYFGMKGHLATITDSAENQTVQLIVPNSPSMSGNDVWLAATDDYASLNSTLDPNGNPIGKFQNQSESEGKWYWAAGPESGQQIGSGNVLQGQPFTTTNSMYQNFDGPQPNNTDGIGASQNYLTMMSAGNGKWNDWYASDPNFVPATIPVYNGEGLPTTNIDLVAKNLNVKINYDLTFPNGDFSDTSQTINGTHVKIPGWEIVNEQVMFGQGTTLGSSIIGGFQTPIDSTPTAIGDSNRTSSGDDSVINYSTYNTTFNSNVSMAQGNLSVPPGAISHGPYIISDKSIYINSGANISFDWKAESISGGDSFDVYAYLLNVDDGSTIPILNETGPDPRGNPQYNWQTAQQNISQSGNYKFVFVSGTFDYSFGTASGAKLSIDNVKVSGLTLPLNNGDTYKLSINGTKIAAGPPDANMNFDLTSFLQEGNNDVKIEFQNPDGSWPWSYEATEIDNSSGNPVVVLPKRVGTWPGSTATSLVDQFNIYVPSEPNSDNTVNSDTIVTLSSSNWSVNKPQNIFSRLAGSGTGSTGGFIGQAKYISFGGSVGLTGNRSLKMDNLDLRGKSSINFDLISGNDKNGGENPFDNNDNDGLDLSYSIDGGKTFQILNSFGQGKSPINWTNQNISIPVEAQTSSTMIKFEQKGSSGTHFDNWGLANINFVNASNNNIATITPLASIIEYEGPPSGKMHFISQINVDPAPTPVIPDPVFDGWTFYSTITLNSDKNFEITTGEAKNTINDLHDLGIQENVYGGVDNGIKLANIDVSTIDGNSDALKAIDAALNQISDLRSSLGAIQNRLQSAIENLTDMKTNTSISNSRIADTDYSSSTVSLARAAIINNAATAILAQSNQQTQMILQLLKSNNE